MVYEATDNTFDRLIQGDYTVVDFYGTHCGPCRMLEPIFSAMSDDYAMIQFVKVNIDTCPQLRERFHIVAVPTLKYFRNGTLYYDGIRHGDRSVMDAELSKLLY